MLGLIRRKNWIGALELLDIDALATYNAEVSRGISHTRGYQARMEAEQAFFDEVMERERDVQRRTSERRRVFA